MIAYIKGELLDVGVDGDTAYAEVLTQSGVGYKVWLPTLPSALDTAEEAEFFIESVYREDSQTLYGFFTGRQREYFRILTGISGIGPKTALNIVSAFDMDTFAGLVEAGEFAVLSKQVKGLGTKGAKRIILELQGKLVLTSTEKADPGGAGEDNELIGDIKMALESLGYRGGELRDKMTLARRIIGENADITVEALLVKLL